MITAHSTTDMATLTTPDFMIHSGDLITDTDFTTRTAIDLVMDMVTLITQGDGILALDGVIITATDMLHIITDIPPITPAPTSHHITEGT